jgi:hypothetical protein
MYHYTIVSSLAEQHRADLVRQADAARLVREAASSEPGRRVRRSRVITVVFRRRLASAG